jgi:hypothetical protein
MSWSDGSADVVQCLLKRGVAAGHQLPDGLQPGHDSERNLFDLWHFTLLNLAMFNVAGNSKKTPTDNVFSTIWALVSAGADTDIFILMEQCQTHGWWRSPATRTHTQGKNIDSTPMTIHAGKTKLGHTP